MDLDRRACDRARRSRDRRFDGRFFIGVTTTRVYCRPICPAPAPNDAHVVYFATAAAAQAAGFRPCLRCRPEASPGTPAWRGTSGVVTRALRLISEGALDHGGLDALADRLGVTARHLRRLFSQHLGASPLDVALTRRLHFAKKLLDETALPCSEIARAAGYGSVRRFNSEIRRVYARTPTALRQRAGSRAPGSWSGDEGAEPECYRVRLAFRPPYDWEAMREFLRGRAMPGVEAVEGSEYRRTIAIDGMAGTVAIRPCESDAALVLEVRVPNPSRLLGIVERVRRVFDLTADPTAIAESLAGDPLLSASLRRHPGIRTPGAWDGFELAVRAILGQQVSVRAATTLAGRLAAQWGSPVACGLGLDRLFPSPAQLVDAPLETAGIVSSRAATIRLLARRVIEGGIDFDGSVESRAVVEALRSVPGIGDWTAQYIAMRALNEPDAFPSGDLVLRRIAGGLTARALEARAEAWRPWRAYAVMLLWQEASHASASTSRNLQDVKGSRHAEHNGRSGRSAGRPAGLSGRVAHGTT